MQANPTGLNGIRQGLLVLVRDQGASMPSCAPVKHVENHVFVDEQKVTLDLLIEGVRDIHTAHVVRAWLGPPG